jgi:hypothetical protein
MADTSITLQRLILPDTVICTEEALYARTSGPANLRLQSGDVTLQPGGTVRFDTYMNLLNLGTWSTHCQLDGLALTLTGAGHVALRVTRLTDDVMAPQILLETDVVLEADTVHDLTNALTDPAGLIAVAVTAISDANLTGGAFTTSLPASSAPFRLAIAITTFRREYDVAQTAARITGFFDGPGKPLLAQAEAQSHLFVVDNGQSASPTPNPALTLIPNANLGGAGGFARGLVAAQDGGFSHCLFMDDDASFELENLIRTIAFLRLARSPRAAVAGAMISSAAKWRMWENGARFWRACRPQYMGTDLRDLQQVITMERDAALPKPAHFYGGWWYFAFPVDQVRHYPYPFFVRGDDISFSLANQFDTATLGGVVSFQDDFAAKESPLTLYLDMRNHLHHHLTQVGMQFGWAKSAWVVGLFFLRSIVRMHYDSANAQLTAWEDVMRGPDFFRDNADMMVKRAQINADIKSEEWQTCDPDTLPPPCPLKPPGTLMSYAMKFTLNGHLIPFWRGTTQRIALADRGLMWPLWGAGIAHFTNAATYETYVVRHDKAQFRTLLGRGWGLLQRWRHEYAGLQAAYVADYSKTATRAFWESQFEARKP